MELLKKTTQSISICLLALTISCGLVQTRPKLEMSIAQSAFVAAKESGAATHAPSVYRKAELYYLKAKSAYKKKYFNKAKEYAILSKKYSEKAELTAERNKILETDSGL